MKTNTLPRTIRVDQMRRTPSRSALCRANLALQDRNADLLEALHKLDANAAENPEWIRRVARAAIAKAEGRA